MTDSHHAAWPWWAAGTALAMAIVVVGMVAVVRGDDMRSAVDAAFEAVRDGDRSKVGTLAAYGPAAIDDLARYAQDPDPRVRLESVTLLAEIGGSRTAGVLVGTLGDPSADIRDIAARAVLTDVMRSGKDDIRDLRTPLLEGIERGKPGAAAILLLGYVSDHDEIFLTLRNDQRLVKLHPWSKVVPVAVPATIAASRRGDAVARVALGTLIDSSDLPMRELMIDAIGTIDATELLVALANVALLDDRPTSSALPAGTESPRRVKDRAVNAFVGQLKLEPGFELSEIRRYSEPEIARVRSLILGTLPQ